MGGQRGSGSSGSTHAEAAIALLSAEAAAAIDHGDLMNRLRESAERDELTGRPNRRSWKDALSREMARAVRTGSPLCVALLDLDGVKQVNDERGHQVADRLLKETTAQQGRRKEPHRPGGEARPRLNGQRLTDRFATA